MFDALKNHWPEYLMEAWGLGTFMVSACVFGVFLFHPDSYFAEYNIVVRNVLMESPWARPRSEYSNRLGERAPAIICNC